MKSNSRVLRGWRDFGVKATAIILTILLATQMVGTPAFASGALTNKQASEDIATTVDDTGVEPSGTEATDTTVPDEAAGAANEPAPADSTQATEEPVVETVESATEPATETPAADPAANAVLGTEPAPAPDSGSEPAPAVEQDQLASIKLNLADGASITLSKDGNKIDDDTNPVKVPANEELKFTAAAPEGMQVSAVKTAIDNIESDPISADENGEYTVAAEDVTDGLTVKVETSAVEGENLAAAAMTASTLSRSEGSSRAQGYYDGYFYLRKPGTGVPTGSDADKSNWFYIDKVSDAVEGSAPDQSGNLLDSDYVKKYPDQNKFPEIVYKEHKYTYSATDTADPYTYTVTWQYAKNSSGATGDNGETIFTGPCYHVDGYANLNIPNEVTVGFMIQKPGNSVFETCGDDWPATYNEGADISSDVPQPEPQVEKKWTHL